MAVFSTCCRRIRMRENVGKEEKGARAGVRKCYHFDMIEWTPELSTGIAQLDEHHKEIFQWLAELESAAVEERTLFGVYALTRFKQYVREHFSVEEALMKSAGYPGLVEHLEEHAAFRAKLRELQRKAIGQDVSVEAVDFLKDWLTTHIAKTDMAYVPYLKK